MLRQLAPWRCLACAWLCSTVFVASGRVTAADAPPVAMDPSDLWWTSTESGWGMQLVQGGNAAFATLFIYDVAGKATFLTATLAQTGSGWSGDLYQTSGPYFGAPMFAPALVSARKVGTLAFTASTSTLALLQYSVDGLVVTKNVERTLLKLDDYSGRYVATVSAITANCPTAGENGEQTAPYGIAIAQASSTITMDWTSAGVACHYAGAYSQLGKLGAIEATYQCGNGEVGNMAFSDMTVRAGMIAGRFQGHGVNNGCDHRGQFTGLVPY